MGLFKSMDEVREANRNRGTGDYWFSPATLRFFSSRVGDTLYGGRFFVTSEHSGPSDPTRWYSVRVAHRDGGIGTVGGPSFNDNGCSGFLAYPTRERAVSVARRIAELYPADRCPCGSRSACDDIGDVTAWRRTLTYRVSLQREFRCIDSDPCATESDATEASVWSGAHGDTMVLWLTEAKRGRWMVESSDVFPVSMADHRRRFGSVADALNHFARRADLNLVDFSDHACDIGCCDPDVVYFAPRVGEVVHSADRLTAMLPGTILRDAGRDRWVRDVNGIRLNWDNRIWPADHALKFGPLEVCAVPAGPLTA